MYFTKKASDENLSKYKVEKNVTKRPYLFDHEHSTLVLGTDHPNCFSVWRQTPSTTKTFKDNEGKEVFEQDPLEKLKYELSTLMYYRDP